MFCYKCGSKANDEDRFCKQCGTILRQQKNTMKTIKLTCGECHGILEVDRDRQVISCPYCGSKRLIQESDEVTIARINKAADAERMRHEKEMKEYEEELRVKKELELKEKQKEGTKVLIRMWILLAFLILLWIILELIF